MENFVAFPHQNEDAEKIRTDMRLITTNVRKYYIYLHIDRKHRFS